MGKYIQILEDSYNYQQDRGSRIDYLCDVFEFITYDDDMSRLFVIKMLDVLQSILDRKTFKYIEDKSQYKNYLTMINMPFLIDKIDWGTSIRGAWFDNSKEYYVGHGKIKIDRGEFTEFVEDLIDWVK